MNWRTLFYPLLIIIKALRYLLDLSLRSIRWLLHALVGDINWQMPGWLVWLKGSIRQYIDYARVHKGKAALHVVSPIILLVSGLLAWQWYEHLPKPITTSYSLKTPGISTYYADRIDIKPLVINFRRSVAPLQAINTDISAGIQLTPSMKGTWHWNNDSTLTFTPQEDWKIDENYELTFSQEGLLAEHIRLDKYEVEFNTPAFTLNNGRAEFFQDPLDPDIKKMIVTLRFSHPVDAVTLERNLVLEAESGLQVRSTVEKMLNVTYSDDLLTAYVHTSSYLVPKIPRKLKLKLENGVEPKSGGNALKNAGSWSVDVPGRGSLTFNNVSLDVVEDGVSPVQVIQFSSSVPVTETEINRKLKVWLLPEQIPGKKAQQGFAYWGKQDVDYKLLTDDIRLPLIYQSGEFDSSAFHALTFKAQPGRYLYVVLPEGMQAVGGYESVEGQAFVMRVPDYPKFLKFMSEGSLLSLNGEKKVAVISRGYNALTFGVRRILPGQLHHFVDGRGRYMKNPSMREDEINSTAERFTQNIRGLKVGLAESQISELDLGAYLNRSGSPRGVFMLSVNGGDSSDYDNYFDEDQRRLVVLTDLGMIVKSDMDANYDVYVMSLSAGNAAVGVKVELIGKNGQPLSSNITDADGHVKIRRGEHWTREKQPLMFVASKGDDATFIPYDSDDRSLNYSRFDIGGEDSAAAQSQLSAYVFSDRNLYRPGESVRLMYAVRSADWKSSVLGLPVKLEIRDPRGLSVWNARRTLDQSGFDGFEYATTAAALSGEYTLNVYLERGRYDERLMGSSTFTLREFEPDRLKVRVAMAEKIVKGWLTPEEVKASVNVQYLFGNPAEDARVVGSMTIRSAAPYFAAYRDYRFYDATRNNSGADINEALAETSTDAAGNASFDLHLKRFDKSIYRIDLLTQAFEKGSGRGVTAQGSALVSSADYMVGVKADGELKLPLASQRNLHWLAINAQLDGVALQNISLELSELRYVSVLARQNDGTYRYVSRQKEKLLSNKDIAFSNKGFNYALDTSNPGEFILRLKDKRGAEISRVAYSVAGTANLSRSLERNAELKVTLNKSEYRPGESIDVNIIAPYAGSGLITIERDKVFTQKWFKTSTTSSIQHIVLPANIEGNAYVNVQFVRDMQSPEVFMSPLSYGVVPFSINREARIIKSSLSAPDLVRPGSDLKMQLNVAEDTRAVLVAVDEGILQVAKFTTPDPLAHFFRKKRLQVETRQILDLILPEFSQLLNAAAPGGDADALLAENLNPFKKKRQPPVVWWSGIQDLKAGQHEYNMPVPDYFNGRIRIYAVLVNSEKVAVHEAFSKVQGEIILSPTVPAAVSPGDELILSLGVYNNIAGSGNAEINIQLDTANVGEVLDGAQRTLKIAEGKDQLVEFKVRANAQLGEMPLVFTAKSGNATAKYRESMSIRPASPFRTVLNAGSLQNSQRDFKALRDMYPQFRSANIAVSPSPLIWAKGLQKYLDNYSHACSEQITSRAIPDLIFKQYPELHQGQAQAGLQISDAIRVLRSRQNDTGGFGLWSATPELEPYVSLYVVQFLLEARERHEEVPEDMLRYALQNIKRIAQRDSNAFWELRQRAFAAYLLTRSGENANGIISTLRADLDKYFPKVWHTDLTAAYLAGAMALQKQTDAAWLLMKDLPWVLGQKNYTALSYYQDELTYDAVHLYLLAAHFPQHMDTLPAGELEKMGNIISTQSYHSHSAGQLLLALDRYHQFANRQPFNVQVAYSDAKGQHSLKLQENTLLKEAVIPLNASALKLSSGGDLPVFYSIQQAGFDAKTGSQENHGMEIKRDFTDLAGKAITAVKVGQEFNVRLRFRALQAGRYEQIAIVDLLPGGIEPVPVVSAPDTRVDYACEDEGCDEETDQHASGGAPFHSAYGVQSDGDWTLEYDNVRDDRVVLYGYLSAAGVSTVTYRVRAVNPGEFVVPVSMLQSMYDPAVSSVTGTGKISIAKP